MKNNLIWKLIGTILVFVKSVQLECVCIQNKQQANCILYRLNEISVRNTQGTKTVAIVTTRTDGGCTLPENAISFDKMEHVALSCEIDILKVNAFKNQEELKNLDLSENFISTIPNDFFANIPRLENLNLSHNTFQNPTLDTFYALNNLKVLDISFNSISSLGLGIFDEMMKLEELHLNNNKIPKIELGVFDLLHNLKIIDLSYNHLHEIVLGLFDQSQKLADVYLSGNYFVGNLPLGTFDSFKNVITLHLKDCQIEKFPLGVFDQMPKLIYLDLNNNKIKKFPLGIFDEAKDLKILDLANNALAKIPDYVFDQTTKLESLDLSRNKLQTLPGLLFQQTESLKYLNLSKNSIAKLQKKMFQWTYLTVIDISYNKFITIEPDLLNIETLARVYAQNNRINYLDDLTFASSNFPLQYLDIRNNRLVFLGEHFFDWVKNLKRMEVFGNPWDCTCLEDIMIILTHRSIRYTSTGYYEGKLPICVVPQTNSDKCDFTATDKNILSNYYQLYNERT
ncbi:hypothetical protein ILUMI_21865 [Ignelater luminosus]|uniref:Uncharacterized protein n=1 Tax=Ignelater luminosus TaxID=2038154 RepID=A0A8K0CBN1_IGNLU|nr:hypothetical protein ILUMI_21865 [Ignelater luminosus]